MKVHVPSQGYGAILFNVFKHAALPAFKKESEDLAAKIVADLKLRLRKQLFNHVPLSAKYKKRKIKFGYDARILIASEQYYNSICVIKTEYGAKVGVKDVLHYRNPMKKGWKPRLAKLQKREKEGKNTGSTPGTIPMVELARMLEFGTTRSKVGKGGPRAGQAWYMPPRPHWRPVMSKFAREHNLIKRKFTEKMVEATEKALETELQRTNTTEVVLKK